MNQSNMNEFLNYCHQLQISKDHSDFLEDDTVWTEERKWVYQNGIIAGLYREKNPMLMNLLNQSCNHNELCSLLNRRRKEYLDSGLAKLGRKYGGYIDMPPVTEPLAKWIYENDYMLTCPLCGDVRNQDAQLFESNPEMVLSYVYLVLKYRYFENDGYRIEREQPHIDAVYGTYFDKSSEYKSWGLLPVDGQRELNAMDDPARIIDKSLNKTIFLMIPRPLAGVIKELMGKGYVSHAAFQGEDNYIYDGVNHLSRLFEAVEKGAIFTLNIWKLPEISRLYSDSYADSLWVIHEENSLTFEELCDDITIEDEAVITQMVHLQYECNAAGTVIITHLDHEYIFYDFDSYEKRTADCRIKGEAKKRIKTFKIDSAKIPMDYPCSMFESVGGVWGDVKEITVPFIYFVLDTYFQHKDLLREYFQNVL